MRPVDKGDEPFQLKHYQDACEPLENRLGRYCCFCERWLATHLAVEHVMPKSRHGSLTLVWQNLLPACVNCNSGKGDTPVTRPPNGTPTHLWPDEHNTLLAFSYVGRWVEVSLPTNHPAFALAQASVQLLGLDKYPEHPNAKRRPTPHDKRWKFREDIAGLAQRSYERLRRADSQEMREQIIETALTRGGFSIWFATFANDVDMQRRLIDAFPGTAIQCFDGVIPMQRDMQVL